MQNVDVMKDSGGKGADECTLGNRFCLLLSTLRLAHYRLVWQLLHLISSA